MTEKRKKVEWIDDGRVISGMNVDGMNTSIFGPKNVRRTSFDEFGKASVRSKPIELSEEEKRAIRHGVFKAYILTALIAIAFFVLLFLFLKFLWFK